MTSFSRSLQPNGLFILGRHGAVGSFCCFVVMALSCDERSLQCCYLVLRKFACDECVVFNYIHHIVSSVFWKQQFVSAYKNVCSDKELTQLMSS